jgi:hypothetical protein
LLPNPNSNGCPLANLGLLIGTYNFGGLNTIKEGYVSTLVVSSLVDLLVSTIVVVVVANDVGNALNFQWSPSNLHICPHPSANVLHPLETLCHVPS